MKLHTLKPANGSVKKKKRIARGQGSGRGGTSTRGHKGAQSRSGYSRKPGFEGGQMPLQRRIPKFGFKNPNSLVYKPVNLDTIQMLVEKNALQSISFNDYVKNGLLSKNDKVKILGRGKLKTAVEVTAHAFSATAKTNIESAGGQTIIIDNK